MKDNLIYPDESYEIIGACMEVHKNLGYGFLEPVYQEALKIEFQNNDISFEREKQLNIKYKGRNLNKCYYSDFVCYDKIVIEIKALSSLNTDHMAQLLNYLKATGYKLGILVNFGEKSLNYKRVVKSAN